MYSKADTHIHTTYSDGFASPEDTIDLIVKETDLRVVAITDHDTAEGAFVAHEYAQRYVGQLEVIIGQEVTTNDGDVLALYIHETLPKFRTAEAAIDAIHGQGGLAIAAHPFSYWLTFKQMQGLATRIFDLPLDGIEARNGFPTNLIGNTLTTWLNRTKGQHLPELGGSDSHVPYTIGQPCTVFPGHTAADYRLAIETGTVRPSGLCWSMSSMARLIPIIAKNGFPDKANAVGRTSIELDGKTETARG